MHFSQSVPSQSRPAGVDLVFLQAFCAFLIWSWQG